MKRPVFLWFSTILLIITAAPGGAEEKKTDGAVRLKSETLGANSMPLVDSTIRVIRTGEIEPDLLEESEKTGITVPYSGPEGQVY